MPIQDHPGFPKGFLARHLHERCRRHEFLADEERIASFVNRHPDVLSEDWTTIRRLAIRESGPEKD